MTTGQPADTVRALKARDQESYRLLEDANGWLKNVVIPDAMDYDRVREGLDLLIRDIAQHLKACRRRPIAPIDGTQP